MAYEDAVDRLAAQSDAVGRLAHDSGGFAAAVAAFEAKDANAFRWVLERLEMLPYCELICEWVRIKFGVLRCIEVCGASTEKGETPNLQQFARAIVQLASNEKLLRRVVDAVSCGDGEDYRAAIAELKLNDFCYLLCHWVYSIIYYRVCYVVCSPDHALLGDAVSEIRNAGKEIAGLLDKKKAFDAIGKAAVALDCEILKSTLNEFGIVSRCEIICRLICAWRYVWICREFCRLRPPVLSGAYGVEEAQNFALASRQLAGQPRALADLIDAVKGRNAVAFGEIIDRFGLAPYCYQVCAWVCAVTCHEFCICVCPPSALPPWFTLVGNFDIYTQIDPTSGLTNTQLTKTVGMPYGGGPNFAFYNQLVLGGWCPATSPTSPGVQMRYRFLYAKNLTTLASAITSAAQTSITVASSAGVPATPFNVSICYSDPPYEAVEIMTVSNVSGTTWTVTRGVDGTTAAVSIAAGATLALDPSPITGPLVDEPVLVGQRLISWPADSSGKAGSLTPTFEPVYVGYGTDPLPPAPSTTYVGPKHYLEPDPATGWVDVDTTLIAGGVQTFLSFDSRLVTPGPCELPSGPCYGTPGGAPAGTGVPVTNQGAGTDLTIIFQATRVGAPAVDYANSLCKIRVNNWVEVNNLWFVEFGAASCCNPIDTSLSVQYTVDHEEMSAGGWTLEIDSCSGGSAPGNITPTVSGPGVTITPRGGWGTIVENTSGWNNCSYQVWLTTRPGLTTGVYDYQGEENLLTFCICGHGA